MKRVFTGWLVMIWLVLVLPQWALAQPSTLDRLIQTLRKEGLQERQHQRRRLERFRRQHDQRKKMLAKVEAEIARAKQHAERLKARFEANEKRLAELEGQWKSQAGDIQDLFGHVRQNAAAIRTLLEGSLVNAQHPGRLTFLQTLIQSRHQADLEDLRKLWDLLLEEIGEAGKVVRFEAPVIAPSGEQARKKVVRVGVFNAFHEGNYLRYLAGGDRLLQPAEQPPLRYRRLARELEQAGEGWHPVALDSSKGALLALMIQKPDWRERLRQGGVIGYLILALGAIGLLLALLRYVWLRRVEHRIWRQQRQEEARDDNPIGRLRLALATPSQHAGEALAVYLEELTQQELQHLYRGLSTLSLFATISPLLGLLGTVTGMIETFDSIALFGTGDPKLMSGGISQALVTTQLGLAVAVPLLLIHSFLRGRASRVAALVTQEAAQLHEQAVDKSDDMAA